MKIQISGHHVEVTASVRAHVEEKFSKIIKHFPGLIGFDVIISKEHGLHQVDIRTNYEGVAVAASGTDEVMYPAIMVAVKKLETALKHRKGQLKADLHEKPQCTTPPIAHEIIQEMDLSK
ncbi:ribosome hibernation-promoting factor, HPF/YfiA family [Shewanella fodinae]|uniref:ribosome hibernation-promoting factor, HPF/YfiA family n=1 Tax=Shewanella fodinae TaxID=552357 RepID=UPI00167267C2|nr:ribosome-associated translation inhibitor RaiA [Shewanella fodinae]MCL2907982.1 ribosome-associated translation inhibitor RaiA [Shewanella fodinae]GGZ12915.1 ribosomal subunit interface protein [Shewanella fodinae]